MGAAELTNFFFRACACMGPQGTDPYCPCRMQRKGLDGHYNCHGDKERSEDDRKRLEQAMERFRLMVNREISDGGG